MPTTRSLYCARSSSGRPTLSLPKTSASPGAKLAFEVALLGDRAEEMEATRGLRRRLLLERVDEMREIEVPAHVDEVPVVDARSAHTVLVDAEAERADEVERRRRGGTKPGDVAGVRRDLGLDEDDVERAAERGCT